MEQKKAEIKAIIGLGNPGNKFYNNRHNIGFKIIDMLATIHLVGWNKKDTMEISQINNNSCSILLIKPQTFMNDSGKVMPFLLKKGIKDENILVIHDELELPFGKFKIRLGGSAKGHNGLRSIIHILGQDFWRLSFGIGRPSNKKDVSAYVLSDFSESPTDLEFYSNNAVTYLHEILNFSH